MIKDSLIANCELRISQRYSINWALFAMYYKRFEELPIWKSALEITRLVYDLTANPRWSKDFPLRDQARRAVISISSNIVEGFEKNNNNEFIRFLRIAKGSTGELRNQFYIGLSAKHITVAEFEVINSRLQHLAREIGGLIIYLEKYRAIHNKKKSIRNS
jgi:four helix bundle protein